jgi:hypothetical protein
MIYVFKIHTEVNHMQNLKFRIIKPDTYLTFIEEAAYICLASRLYHFLLYIIFYCTILDRNKISKHDPF